MTAARRGPGRIQGSGEMRNPGTSAANVPMELWTVADLAADLEVTEREAEPCGSTPRTWEPVGISRESRKEQKWKSEAEKAGQGHSPLPNRKLKGLAHIRRTTR